MREYDARQTYSRHRLDERVKEVMENVDGYSELSDSIAMLSVEAAKANMRGDSSGLNSLSGKLASIRKRMEELLRDNNYPDDYLAPHYECADCRDTGYIGKEKCHCFKQATINLLYRQSNLSQNTGDAVFDNFRTDCYSTEYVDPVTGYTPRDNAVKVLDICRNFANNFGSGDNLLLYGDTGVGKTFLSSCIARQLLDRGHSVLYLSAIELFERLSIYTDDDAERDESQILDCELLIIDDLGTELSNSFTGSRLFMCINERLLNERSTIISTNLSPKDLMANYSERIFSRISSSYKLLKLFGDDIRLLNK